MKKVLLSVLTIIIISSLSFGQSIWFNSPKNGQVYGNESGDATVPVNFDCNFTYTPYPPDYGVGTGYKLITGTATFDSREGDVPQWFYLAPGTYTWTVELWEFFLGHSSWEKTATQTITFYCKNTIKVQNNFLAGNIVVDNTTRTSGFKINKLPGEILKVGAVDQFYDTYSRIWNMNGQNNSDWQRKKVRTAFIPLPAGNTRNYDYQVETDDHGAIIMANLRKVCNVSFANALTGSGQTGSLKINGATVSAPTSNYEIVEGNSINVAANNMYDFGGPLRYFFNKWSDGYTEPERSYSATQHAALTANYKRVPVFDQTRYRNMTITAGAARCVKLTWNEHPDAGVTKYYIYRQIVSEDGVKVTRPIELIGTVNRGTTTFTDYDYGFAKLDVPFGIMYDVKAYYAPDNTFSDPDQEEVTAYWAGMLKDGKDANENIITEYSISNYPNPFNPATTIKYSLKEDGFVTLKVYDMLGREVSTLVNEFKEKGVYQAEFNGSGLTSGIYIYAIKANDFSTSGKMMLSK